MPVDRAQVDQYLAFLAFALSFLFVLAIVALAFNDGMNETPLVSTQQQKSM